MWVKVEYSYQFYIMSYRRTFSKEASVPTIAMADSQQMFRSSIKAQLSSFGYEVYLEAASGEELIHSLEACSVLPDICFSTLTSVL